MMKRRHAPLTSTSSWEDTFLSSLRHRIAKSAVAPSQRHFQPTKLGDLRLEPRGSSTMCCSTFSLHPNRAVVRNRIFECPNKHIFLNATASYCHICHEPLGVTAATHMSNREHHNIQLFLFLSTAFPRSALCDTVVKPVSSATAPTTNATGMEVAAVRESNFYHHSTVLKDAARLFPCFSVAVASGYVHTEQDALRRSGLQSMFVLLSCGSFTSHNADRKGPPVLKVFHGDVLPELAHSGERLFKREVSRLIVEWFPAMSAGVSTQIAHKCWGRSNLESVFDALKLQTLIDQRCSGSIRADSKWKAALKKGLGTKSEKATFMRLLMWELTTRNEEVWGPINSAGERLSELDCLLLQLTRRQLAFEMVYLQSLKYMQWADGILREMSFPTLEELVMMGAA